MPANNSTKKKNKKESDWRTVNEKLKSHVRSQSIEKLLEQEQQFIFEVIKILYEDVLEYQTKIEILLAIEQECSGCLPKSSVDQVISSLLDIYDIEQGTFQTLAIREQLYITVTTIFINNDGLLDQEIGTSFISKSVEMLRKTNNVATRRLRSLICNCLSQLEQWRPGILWKWKDLLSQLCRDERTDVCQDYFYLLVTVIRNAIDFRESYQDYEDRGILQSVSYLMDSVFLLTSSGAIAVLPTVVELVQNTRAISSSIFKPLMLQYIPCSDPSILFLALYIQSKFRGEILTYEEERLLLLKVLGVVKHGSIPVKARLLAAHWLTTYICKCKCDLSLEELHAATHLTVFDPLPIHTCKLGLRCLCLPANKSYVVCQDLFYLNQLAEKTGRVRVSSALYHILYQHVSQHSCDPVNARALAITKTLFQKYPHLIPLIVDFLHTLQSTHKNLNFHIEVLTLLHNTVLSVPMGSLLANYHNYLQVWLLSAQDPAMNLQKQLRRMLELAKEANSRALDDWSLGCLLLSICRIMLLHHNYDIFYCQMGDLLFYMMHDFSDPDIQDYARFHYALLTMTSNSKAKEILKADVMDNLKFGENLADILPGSMVQTLSFDIRKLDEAPITCKRKSVAVEFEESLPYPVEQAISAKDYYKMYKEDRIPFKTVVNCELVTAIKDDSEMDNLIAMSLNISNTDDNIAIEEIHIPFLTKKEESKVSFQFCPLEPAPCDLKVQTMFCFERGTLQCDLDPIKLTLADLLVPFPWHLYGIGVAKQWSLFDKMWKYFLKQQEFGKTVESVKLLSCSSQVLTKHWKEAAVSNGVDNPDCFLFLLMPSYHFLLRIVPHDSCTVIEMASDTPQVLQYLDDYLDGLMPS